MKLLEYLGANFCMWLKTKGSFSALITPTFYDILHPNLETYTIAMKYCTKVHGHGVKHESGIKNKWHFKSFRSEERLESTIFRDPRNFLGTFDTLILL